MCNDVHTFVILAHKESKYLEECIKSVVGQSVQGKILIVTSTLNDHIVFLAKKYGIEIRINADGGNIGKDWNFGFQQADTKFVTLAHQDDLYASEFAEKCIGAARQNTLSAPLIIFTNSHILRGGKKVFISYKNILRWLLIFPFHIKRCITAKAWKKFILLFSNSISCPGVFYVKENLQDFRFDDSDAFALDWKAWLEMSRRDGAFIYLPSALHIHREHDESATSTMQKDVLEREEYKLLVSIWGTKLIPKIITFFLRIAK